MKFSKLSSPSLKDLFVLEIENMIISGNLSIGEKIPTERDLAEQMSVSRTVVNSGLSELSRKGFIDIQPRVGAFVADYHRNGTIETLNAILRYKGGIMNKLEMKSLLELRLIIETLAIELATPLLTAENLVVLKKLSDDFKAAKDPVHSAQCIFLLHHELCILSGNTMLPIVFYSFRELSLKLWERYFILHGNDDLCENTDQLYKCLKNGDTKCAIATFKNSLKKTITGDVSIYFEA